MTVKVLIRRPIRLTDAQVSWLQFLASERGTKAPEGSGYGSMGALINHGLIKPVHGWGYRPTKAGYDVLTQLAGAGDDLTT